MIKVTRNYKARGQAGRICYHIAKHTNLKLSKKMLFKLLTRKNQWYETKFI